MKLRDRLLQELYRPKGLNAFKKEVGHINAVDSRDKSWSYGLPAYMERYGFSFLGSGKYASVFGHPRYPYVIKVFMKDAAFLGWMKFCLENKDNPYCPKFKGKVIKISEYIFAVRVEKLTSLKSMAVYNKFESELKTGYSDDPDLQKCINHINTRKNLLDMHSENVMMRGDQLVIVDTWYNWFNVNSMKYTIDPDKVDLKGLI